MKTVVVYSHKTCDPITAISVNGTGATKPTIRTTNSEETHVRRQQLENP